MNTASVPIKPQSVVAVIHLGYFELLPPHSQQAISNQNTFESICSLFLVCALTFLSCSVLCGVFFGLFLYHVSAFALSVSSEMTLQLDPFLLI